MLLILAYVDIYTISYSIWEWKNGNRAGSLSIFVLCIGASVLSLIKIFV